jgi:DNA topoisomerase IA
VQGIGTSATRANVLEILKKTRLSRHWKK